MPKYRPIHTGMRDHPLGYDPYSPRITHYERIEDEMENINRIRSMHQQRVDEFNTKKGVRLPIAPFIPEDRQAILNQIRIIFDEVLELVNAAGVDLGVRYHGTGAGGEIPVCKALLRYKNNPTRKVDIKEVADGFADVSVTITGLLSMFGISDLGLLEKVDESNLDKYNVPKCEFCNAAMQEVMPASSTTPAVYECMEIGCNLEGVGHKVKGHYIDNEGKLKKPSNWEERHKYDIQEVLLNQGMPEELLLAHHRRNYESEQAG